MGYSQFGAITNKAVINTCTQIPVSINFHFSKVNAVHISVLSNDSVLVFIVFSSHTFLLEQKFLHSGINYLLISKPPLVELPLLSYIKHLLHCYYSGTFPYGLALNAFVFFLNCAFYINKN